MNLAERIYTLRTERGLSQLELAEALDVSRQSISKWETGAAVPELDKLLAMSRYFGLTVGALLGVEEKGTDDTPDGEADGGELTPQQIKMVQEIADRYIAALPAFGGSSIVNPCHSRIYHDVEFHSGIPRPLSGRRGRNPYGKDVLPKQLPGIYYLLPTMVAQDHGHGSGSEIGNPLFIYSVFERAVGRFNIHCTVRISIAERTPDPQPDPAIDEAAVQGTPRHLAVLHDNGLFIPELGHRELRCCEIDRSGVYHIFPWRDLHGFRRVMVRPAVYFIPRCGPHIQDKVVRVHHGFRSLCEEQVRCRREMPAQTAMGAVAQACDIAGSHA